MGDLGDAPLPLAPVVLVLVQQSRHIWPRGAGVHAWLLGFQKQRQQQQQQ
jgi:hypothetical protein